MIAHEVVKSGEGCRADKGGSKNGSPMFMGIGTGELDSEWVADVDNWSSYEDTDDEVQLPPAKKARTDNCGQRGGATNAVREQCEQTTAHTGASRKKKDHDSESVDLNEEQQRLADLVLQGRNVFYTGGAGTGKSTVLRWIVKALRERGRCVDVVTPTGISAVNAGGSTYFTWAGWHPGTMKEPIEGIKKMAMGQQRRARLLGTQVLIIDEISMLEANHFARLDEACRTALGREDLAFGGMQVVVTGDFYQLPPVKAFQTCFVCGTELPADRGRAGVIARCSTCGREYNVATDQWAFRSHSWKACDFVCVSLKQVHRQSDPVFIAILNRLRKGEMLSTKEMALLDRGGRKGDGVVEADGAVELSPVRREVDEKNRNGFERIETAVYRYRCRDFARIEEHHPHLKGKALPNGTGGLMGCQDHRFPALLETKQGMPVILLSNIDQEAGLVNGSQGKIVGYRGHEKLMSERAERVRISGQFGHLEEEEIAGWERQLAAEAPLPVVRFENGVETEIYPVCLDSEIGDPKPFSVVARTQIPLLPAWAITIHKSQGMTLERAVVNLEGMFERQQAYVALSRVRNLEGLRVKGLSKLGTLQDKLDSVGGVEVVQHFMEAAFGTDGLDDVPGVADQSGQRQKDTMAMADCRRTEAAEKKRTSGESHVSGADEEESKWQTLEKRLERWQGRCGYCSTAYQNKAGGDQEDYEQNRFGHMLSSCTDVGSREAREALRRLRKCIVYANYSACRTCGAPQGMCNKFERREGVGGDGYKYLGAAVSCRFPEVILGGWVGMLFGQGEKGHHEWKQKVRGKGIPEGEEMKFEIGGGIMRYLRGSEVWQGRKVGRMAIEFSDIVERVEIGSESIRVSKEHKIIWSSRKQK